MVQNRLRRAVICDAGIEVLARSGSRGLTHRALDEYAGLPLGTTGNYFPTRTALVQGLIQRIEQRLAPDTATLEALGRRRPSRRLLTTYLQQLLQRLMTDRATTIALFELRLESSRHVDLADTMSTWLRTNHDADLAFHLDNRLPGSPYDLALVRFAIEGLAFDQLTVPVHSDIDAMAVIDDLVTRLIPLPSPRKNLRRSRTTDLKTGKPVR